MKCEKEFRVDTLMFYSAMEECYYQSRDTMRSETIKKIFGAIHDVDVNALVSTALGERRRDLTRAQRTRDTSALSEIVAQILARLHSQIELSLTPSRTVMAAVSEEEREFRTKVVDAVVEYSWFEEDFNLMGVLLELLKVAGQEMLRRIGESVKHVIAPGLEDKVGKILEEHLGRKATAQIIDRIAEEIEYVSIVDWAELTDAELDRLVLQICQQLDIPLTGETIIAMEEEE